MNHDIKRLDDKVIEKLFAFSRFSLASTMN